MDCADNFVDGGIEPLVPHRKERRQVGLLEGTGKNLRHVKLKTSGDLGKPGVAEIDRGGSAAEQKRTDGRNEGEEEQEMNRG